MPQPRLGTDCVDDNVFAGMMFPISLDVGLAMAADHPNSECSQACRIIRLDDFYGRQQRVVRTDVCRIFGGLLNGFHFLLAPSVVKWTHNDGLSKKYVAC